MEPRAPNVVEVRWRIEVAGVVQGVGFRPYVYRLARGAALRGFARNTGGGVTIEVEGPPPALDRFLRRLRQNPPPLARIAAVAVTPIATLPGASAPFAIHPSLASGTASQLELAPDTAPCPRCRADYSRPAHRRFGFAFTNCTHCGPRYTITASLPYDRAQTTMARFPLCPACQREYDSPADRRFHAQPNACPACGPQLALGDARGADAIAQGRQRLQAGQILAIKNVGGYQLACDARNPEAVLRLRCRKRRGDKPFALLARDLATVETLCAPTAAERDSLLRPARPIVLLDRLDASDVSLEAVAPAQPRLGIMLPSSPLQELLLAPPLNLLVMTSGNHPGLPMARTAEEARAQLGGIADAFLDHDREIHMRADDSIVFCYGGRERLLRRARGYVPQTIPLAHAADGPLILAAGGEMKNAFCLLRGDRALLSPHIGEMDSLESAQLWRQTLDHFLHLQGLRLADIAALAYDPHPAYRVSQLARRLPISRQIAVQHHHAHIAGCMAEHSLAGPVLGVAWDGTGYGPDHTVWGGEFLVADEHSFRRAAHLRPVPFIGGDQAVRHPWRLAFAYLADALGPEAAATAAARLWPQLPPDDLHRLATLLAPPTRPAAAPSQASLLHETLTPNPYPLVRLTSSSGRLFDAVAALLGLHSAQISFEAQAAMALEAVAARAPALGPPYRFHISDTTPGVADLRPMIAEIWVDLQRGSGIEAIAMRFHQTLAALIVAVCQRLRQQHRLHQVCLGGGTFQNRLLLAAADEGLRAAGFAVFIPAQAPANDGGLGLGQAVVARARLRHGREGDDDVFGHPRQDLAVV